MSSVSRNSHGPLRHAVLVQIGDVGGVVFWDRTSPPDVDPLPTDQDYIIEIADRSDLLSFRSLQDSNMAWIIMERNKDIEPEEIDMRLWPNDFVPGRTIKIPSRRSISDRGIV